MVNKYTFTLSVVKTTFKWIALYVCGALHNNNNNNNCIKHAHLI